MQTVMLVDFCVENYYNYTCIIILSLIISQERKIDMAKSIAIDEIYCVRASKTNAHIFLGEGIGESFDEHYTFLVYGEIDLYGVPATEIPVKNAKSTDDSNQNTAKDRLTDVDYENLSSLVKLGTIVGTMIMVKELIDFGHNVFLTCDDEDADLGYVISVLEDKNCPMNKHTGNPYQNIFYIREIAFEEKNINKTIKKRIMRELPFIIYEFFHVRPDIMTYIAAPVGDEWKTDQQKADELAATTRVMENFEINLINYLHQDDQPYKSPKHSLSEKDLNVTLGRRTPGEPCGIPLDHKNLILSNFM